MTQKLTDTAITMYKSQDNLCGYALGTKIDSNSFIVRVQPFNFFLLSLLLIRDFAFNRSYNNYI